MVWQTGIASVVKINGIAIDHITEAVQNYAGHLKQISRNIIEILLKEFQLRQFICYYASWV